MLLNHKRKWISLNDISKSETNENTKKLPKIMYISVMFQSLYKCIPRRILISRSSRHFNSNDGSTIGRGVGRSWRMRRSPGFQVNQSSTGRGVGPDVHVVVGTLARKFIVDQVYCRHDSSWGIIMMPCCWRTHIVVAQHFLGRQLNVVHAGPLWIWFWCFKLSTYSKTNSTEMFQYNSVYLWLAKFNYVHNMYAI